MLKNAVTNEPDGNVSLLIYVENCRSVSFYLSFYFSKKQKNIPHICFMSQSHSKGSTDQELQAKSCTQLLAMLSIWDLHQVCMASCAHFVTSAQSEIHRCQSSMLTGRAEGARWVERGSVLRIRRLGSIITPTLVRLVDLMCSLRATLRWGLIIANEVAVLWNEWKQTITYGTLMEMFCLWVHIVVCWPWICDVA